MPSESGFSNQKKLGLAQYKTIHSFGSNKFGVNTAQMLLRDLYPISVAIDSSDEDSDDPRKVNIEIIGHGAREGDILRIMEPGALNSWEFEIIEVLDTDIFVIYNLADTFPQVGDEVMLCRWVTAKGSPSGDLYISETPISPLGIAELDFSLLPVGDAAYVELATSVGATEIKKVQIFMSSGDPLYLAFGAAGVEENKIVIIPGGNGYMDLAIPAGTRLSVISVKAVTVVSGDLFVNLLG